MAGTNLQFFLVPPPVTSVVQLNNASGTSTTLLATGGTNGSIIKRLLAQSTDTNAHDVGLYLTVSSTDYLLGCISLAAGAGNASGTSAKSILDDPNLAGITELDANGNRILKLGASQVLKVAMQSTLTSGKTANFAYVQENF